MNFHGVVWVEVEDDDVRHRAYCRDDVVYDGVAVRRRPRGGDSDLAKLSPGLAGRVRRLVECRGSMLGPLVEDGRGDSELEAVRGHAGAPFGELGKIQVPATCAVGVEDDRHEPFPLVAGQGQRLRLVGGGVRHGDDAVTPGRRGARGDQGIGYCLYANARSCRWRRSR